MLSLIIRRKFTHYIYNAVMLTGQTECLRTERVMLIMRLELFMIFSLVESGTLRDRKTERDELKSFLSDKTWSSISRSSLASWESACLLIEENLLSVY